MSKSRRLFAVVGVLLAVAMLSAPRSEGEQGQKGPVVREVKERDVEKALAQSKFLQGGVITYHTLKGDNYFALQVQPKLEPVAVRKRDYLVMVCSPAAMAGEPWIAATQIADAIVTTANDGDRVALWVVSTPEATKQLTKGFLDPKDRDDDKKLKAAIAELKNKHLPLGDTDLKTALASAVKSFNGGESRQRILLFLGDGQSTHNPIEAADRNALVQDMVKQKIGFFPVPLGIQLNPENLHGLATGTGGVVLRTKVDDEKLPEALKRYQEAFAGPVMYDAQLKLPGAVLQAFPKNLPPLRTDAPTLVVGKLAKDAKTIAYNLSGVVAGRAGVVNLSVSDKVREPELDNYFLASMINQWERAQTQPALIRADRALAFAFEQTKLIHQDIIISAQIALEKNQVAAAKRLYEDARALVPHDAEANAGIKICAAINDGKLTRELIREQMDKAGRKVARPEMVNGVLRWAPADMVKLAQLEQKPAVGSEKPLNVQERDDLLQAHRDRVIVEEQKMTQTVETALRQARKDLSADPEGTLDFLKNTLARIKDHPDLSDRVRDALATRLQAALRESAIQGKAIELKKQEQIKNVSSVEKVLAEDKKRRTIEERVEAQYRVFKNQMLVARMEEKTKHDVIYGLEKMATDARLQGHAVPLVSKASYDMTLAGYNLRKQQELRRLKEERFLAVYLEVDKSHVPFPDEPGIYFPPLATWQAITKLRKEKYEVSSLPDDDKGTLEARSIAKLLGEVIDMKDFQNPMTLKEALGLFYEKFAAKQKELPILVDENAFKEENPDAPDIYETQVKFPAFPKTMTMATALRLALSKIPTNNATYLIRRSFIEVTTNERMVREKVLRVYPVGDLVIPISMNGGQQNFNFQGGGQFGQFGQMGGGQFGQFGGGQFGQFGQFGQMGGGQFGQFGGGQFGQFGGGQFGQFGQFGGGQFGQFGMMGMQMGGMGMMGMQMGGMGMGGGQFGNFQGVGGSFNGGSFQGGFNGSLGALGATQAVGLIDVITKVVAPGEWFYTPQQNPFQQNFFAPFGGGFGMMGMGMFGMGGGMFGAAGGMFGNMGGNFGMMGAGAPPVPVAQGGPADIQKANTIEFFPPALALIIRAPSRIHTSITGGIIGGKAPRDMAAALREAQEERGLAKVGAPKAGQKNPPQVANAQGGEKDPGKGQVIAKIDLNKSDLDPTKIWNEALGKGGVDAGLVVATADFLFECGQFNHAAEFLKANLRAGIVVRPWVYEALAVALEASGGDPKEIQRARLSAVSLDPNDAHGFLQAARAMANDKQYDRALAFCRQAALLEPNMSQPYADALTYAELGKDTRGMEWAATKLLGQDWASDGQKLQLTAQARAQALSQTLVKENRGTEADRIKQALQTLRQRDLVINMSWDVGSEPTDLEMEIKEPSGTVCSMQQKQTPGGGLLQGASLLDMTRSSYVASQAFTGDYEVTVKRLYGQPLGGKARLEIIQNLGTPKETRRLEIVRLDRPATVKFQVKNGRRTELANVPPAIQKRVAQDAESNSVSVMAKLRGLAHPDFAGATAPRGGASTPGAGSRIPPGLANAKREQEQAAQAPAAPIAGAGLNLTAQVRFSNDQRDAAIVLQPVFQTTGSRPNVNLPLIPGAAPSR